MKDFRGFIFYNNISQKDVTEYLGVSKGYLSLVISGKKKLSEENFRKLLENPYNWDTSMLTSESRDEVEEVRANDKSMPERLLDIIEGQKKQIETLLEMLKEKDEEISRLRAELDARKGGTASDAQASSCANVG